MRTEEIESQSWKKNKANNAKRWQKKSRCTRHSQHIRNKSIRDKKYYP
jgi:hypothetical protein